VVVKASKAGQAAAAAVLATSVIAGVSIEALRCGPAAGSGPASSRRQGSAVRSVDRLIPALQAPVPRGSTRWSHHSAGWVPRHGEGRQGPAPPAAAADASPCAEASAALERAETGSLCRVQRPSPPLLITPPLPSLLPHATQAANALTFDELQSLTYLQVKGSGLANTCPVLSTGSTNLKDLKSGSYKLERFCMEPTSFSVKEESQFKGGESGFTKTKLMTRLTYTLDGVRHRGRPGRCGAASLKPAVL
jgi:hypothetical protein